ncbi:MAG: hypothetical protein KF878_16260 [Planctomycetes bacterium]|nr:hypothetical protein [Planctomycetota bacterium]
MSPRTKIMRHHAVSLALVTALVAAAPAAASLVDREAVTLGRLVDDLDLALVVRVDAARGDALDLAVLERLRGPAVPDALRLVLSHEVACDLAARPGERLALFLALGPDGRAEAPVTVWQAVRLTDDAAAALVRDAVRSRAPTIGGDPRALERALFRQLEADGAGPAAERAAPTPRSTQLAFSALAPTRPRSARWRGPRAGPPRSISRGWPQVTPPWSRRSCSAMRAPPRPR